MHYEIPFYGHKNIRSTHQKTIEITTDPKLSTNGNCIIGVKSNSGCNGIPITMKAHLRNSNSDVTCTISVDKFTFKIKGKGHENLILSHPHDIVIRKSSFTCPRTLAIKCDKASNDIPKEMINLLQNSDTKGIFAIDVT